MKELDLNENSLNIDEIQSKNYEKNSDIISAKKKARRSRIIIQENKDTCTEIKKEIYDPQTRLIKSIASARVYNEMLIETRNTISKHFLKKKIKSAFEREPIDKNKSFFNIPFIPNVNMFSAPQQNTNNPNQNLHQQNQMRNNTQNQQSKTQNNQINNKNNNTTNNNLYSTSHNNNLDHSASNRINQLASHNKLNVNANSNQNQPIKNQNISFNSSILNSQKNPTANIHSNTYNTLNINSDKFDINTNTNKTQNSESKIINLNLVFNNNNGNQNIFDQNQNNKLNNNQFDISNKFQRKNDDVKMYEDLYKHSYKSVTSQNTQKVSSQNLNSSQFDPNKNNPNIISKTNLNIINPLNKSNTNLINNDASAPNSTKPNLVCDTESNESYSDSKKNLSLKLINTKEIISSKDNNHNNNQNTEIQSNNLNTSNSSKIVIDYKNQNKIQEDLNENSKIIKNNSLEDILSAKSSSNSLDNNDLLNKSHSLREKLLKQILEIYKTNPEKLYKDLGPKDFSKIRALVNSQNLNLNNLSNSKIVDSNGKLGKLNKFYFIIIVNNINSNITNINPSSLFQNKPSNYLTDEQSFQRNNIIIPGINNINSNNLQQQNMNNSQNKNLIKFNLTGNPAIINNNFSNPNSILDSLTKAKNQNIPSNLNNSISYQLLNTLKNKNNNLFNQNTQNQKNNDKTNDNNDENK